ncbi:MAG: metal ABC transporter ATP-binding protein [Clostridiales bacterium]|jgi:zinc transport system ATP-binding protein|nr:metal ABC transporter ATP-binding protein [Clostridiales bacterium]MDR2749141.1 metal ABC transporter ATP-binding protein [Clostridiales bacterium]
MEIIKASGISFRYGDEPVLSNIDFTVSTGDFVAVIGANGAGKSTMLKLILGELEPAAGVIELFGEDSRKFKDWPRIGYVPQSAYSKLSGFPATVQEIVGSGLYSKIGLFRFPNESHRERVRWALDKTGMRPFAKKLAGSLSGGQQQRVLISRVLVANPDVMLLDEPASGVDAESAASIYDLLGKMSREAGLAVVMVTHDMAKAKRHVSRVLQLDQGSLVTYPKTMSGT